MKSFENSLYAVTLPAWVVRPIFNYMVRLSDEEDLMGMFLAIPCPKMHMFGAQYKPLPYLERLEEQGVDGDGEFSYVFQSGGDAPYDFRLFAVG